LWSTAAKCPKDFRATFPRHLQIQGRRAKLREVTVYDCSHHETGSHEQTTFDIDAKGNPTKVQTAQIPHHAQRMREAFQQLTERLKENERRQKLMLGLLLILMLLTLWSAVGPLFS